MRTFKGLSLDPKDAFRNIASMINTGMLITVIDGEERTDLGDAIFHQAKLYAEAASAYLFTCPQKTYTIPTPSPSPTHQLNAQTAAPDARTLGTRIRAMRKLREMTQAEVAEVVNVTAQAVCLWESDSVIMSVDKLLPLASALQCDPMWLLTGEEHSGNTGNALNTDTADVVIVDGKVVKNRTNNIPPDIGERITLARENIDMTVSELASLLDVDRDIIGQWEDSTGEPGLSHTVPLCEALKCNLNWLITGEETPVIKPADDAAAIGKRINQRRVELRMSPVALQEITGAPDGSVFRWETGKIMPPDNYIDSLAKALETSVTWLLTGKDIAKES
ncbi:helix-turn-helix domain-containing protein [Salmonella enterica]|nr:helix-turn-helix domain-containing protein [Salmonella enterica]